MQGTHDQLGQQANRRAVAAACGTASPLQATAAAPFWRALRDESAIWTLGFGTTVSDGGLQPEAGRRRDRRGERDRPSDRGAPRG